MSDNPFANERPNAWGRWGEADMGGQRRVALRPDRGGGLLWPTEQIRQRLRQGAGGGLAAHYQSRVLLAQP